MGSIATRMEASEVCAAAIANQVSGSFDEMCPEYTGSAPTQCEALSDPINGKVYDRKTCEFYSANFVLP